MGIEINDLLIVKFLDCMVEIARLESRSQAILTEKEADTKQVGLQTSGLMSLLSFIGTLTTANLKKTAAEKTSDIMPVLLGMMGNNGFSPSKTAAVNDPEKPTPGVAKPAEPAQQTQE